MEGGTALDSFTVIGVHLKNVPAGTSRTLILITCEGEKG